MAKSVILICCILEMIVKCWTGQTSSPLPLPWPTDKQTENTTFRHPSDVGGNNLIVRVLGPGNSETVHTGRDHM